MDHSGLWTEIVRRQVQRWQVVKRKWSEPGCSDGRVDRIFWRTKYSMWEKERIHEWLWGLQPETQSTERAELQLLELEKTRREAEFEERIMGVILHAEVRCPLETVSRQVDHLSWRHGKRSWNQYYKFGHQFQTIWLDEIQSRGQPMASHSVIGKILLGHRVATGHPGKQWGKVASAHAVVISQHLAFTLVGVCRHVQSAHTHPRTIHMNLCMLEWEYQQQTLWS